MLCLEKQYITGIHNSSRTSQCEFSLYPKKSIVLKNPLVNFYFHFYLKKKFYFHIAQYEGMYPTPKLSFGELSSQNFFEN